MEIKCSKEECKGKNIENILTMVNEVLSMGELIVYPTETLYGLGVDATKPELIDKVRDIKGTPRGQGISIAYLDIEHAVEYLGDIPELAWDLAKRFTPGPLTIVIEKEGKTEGIRIPNHPLTRQIIEDFGPITSTSANKHGAPSPIDTSTAKTQLGDDVRLYLNCGKCEIGKGTTVVKVDDRVEILREGSISKEELGDVVGC